LPSFREYFARICLESPHQGAQSASRLRGPRLGTIEMTDDRGRRSLAPTPAVSPEEGYVPEDKKKDKKTRCRRWINTGLSASAAVVAGASAFFSSQATEWNVENIEFVEVHPTGKCDSLLAGATLAMCWSVTLSNKRNSRLTVVAATWENMDSSPGDLLFGKVHILAPDGKPVPIPFSLDGGEEKQIMIQIPVRTFGDVAAALNVMEQHQPAPRLLSDVEEQLVAHAGLDFAGNKVTATATREGRVTAWNRERRFAKLTRLVVLQTERRKLFHVELTYPADANELLD
jgi:hypothetical protein